MMDIETWISRLHGVGDSCGAFLVVDIVLPFRKRHADGMRRRRRYTCAQRRRWRSKYSKRHGVEFRGWGRSEWEQVQDEPKSGNTCFPFFFFDSTAISQSAIVSQPLIPRILPYLVFDSSHHDKQVNQR